MIFWFSALIQFLAAIYVTLSFDNVLFRNLWSMPYKTLIKRRLKRVLRYREQSTPDDVLKTIEDKASIIEKYSRRRGLFMLIVSITSMIYIGIEQCTISKDSKFCIDTSQFYPRIASITLVAIMIISSCKLWQKRRWSLLLVLGLFVISAIAVNFLDFNFVALSVVAKWYVDNVLIFYLPLLILPILIQVVENWLYANTYVYIVYKEIIHESNIYQKALMANSHEELPSEYTEAIAKAFFDERNKEEDAMISNIRNEFNNRLQNVVTNVPLWKLLWSGIKYIFNENNTSFIDEDVFNLKGEEVEKIDVEKYKSYVGEYNNLHRKPKMEMFCSERGLDYYNFRKIRNGSVAPQKVDTERQDV